MFRQARFLTEGLPLEPVKVDLEKVFSVASKCDIDFSTCGAWRPPSVRCSSRPLGHHNPGAPGIGPPGSAKTLYEGLLYFRRAYRSLPWKRHRN
jgi:hypothetical protein